MNKITDSHFTIEELTTHFTEMVANQADMLNESREKENELERNLLTPVHADKSNRFVVRQHAPIRLQPDFEPAADDATGYDVAELLQYHDTEFLRNAYRALLKRLPDADGFNRYLHRMRSGSINKIDALASLRYSAEGAARAVRVRGLRVPSLVRRAGRVPVLGYVVRLCVAIARLPHNTELQRKAENHLIRQVARVAVHTDETAQHLAAEIARLAAHVDDKLDAAQRRFDEQHARHAREQHARLRELETRIIELTADLHEHLAASNARFDMHEERFDSYDEQLTGHDSHLSALEEHLAAQRARTDDFAARHHDDALQLLRRDIQHTRMELTLQWQRLAAPLTVAALPPAAAVLRDKSDDEIVVNTNEALAVARVESAFLPEHVLTDDAFYAAFVERFRGSAEEITHRLEAHLSVLDTLPHGEIVDLGSGRGEWLELLRARGREGYGVDTNRLLAADCRARGLRVVEADALAHLRRVPDKSLAGVFGFHIVEHLPLDDLMRLMVEVMRVLQPGGVALFETPNPANLLVGAHLFFTDPTHRHPLPSKTLRFLLEIVGFDEIAIRDLHPRTNELLIENGAHDELTRRFNSLFYSAMDYSISGRKPGAPSHAG